MDISEQVISLKYARKLKQLKIKQISLFYYCERLTGYHNETEMRLLLNKETTIDEISKYSAFSVAELGEMLPFSLDESADSKDYRDLRLCKNAQHYWVCFYVSQRLGTCLPREEEKTEADSRAKMLIHLIEHNLVTEEWRKQWLDMSSNQTYK